MLNSNVLLELLYSPQFLHDSILKYKCNKFSFLIMLPVRFKYDWGPLLYIKHSVGLKLNHDKDSRRVRPVNDSQTVQPQTRTDRLGQETNSKFCLRNTALSVVCRTAL